MAEPVSIASRRKRFHPGLRREKRIRLVLDGNDADAHGGRPIDLAAIDPPRRTLVDRRRSNTRKLKRSVFCLDARFQRSRSIQRPATS